MEKRATVHKVDGKWKALPELSCDLWIGKMPPNQDYIKKYAIDFVEDTDDSTFKENQVIDGKETWDYDEEKILVFKFEIK